jgi:tetratricopeptide (TPR) repeat protein
VLGEEKKAPSPAGKAESPQRRFVVRRFGLPPAVVLLTITAACLAVLFLMRGMLAPLPAVLFLASLALLLVPGFVLTAPLAGEGLLVRLPVAFVLSSGVVALLAVPALVLHTSLKTFLILCAGFVAGSLLLAVLMGRRRETLVEKQEDGGLLGDLLLVLLLFSTGVLALIATTRLPAPGEDAWVYMGYAREFLSPHALGTTEPFSDKALRGLSRVAANGWLVEASALTKLSGVDLVSFFLGYLTPAIVAFSVLAFAALAKVFSRNAPAGLFAGVLYAIYLLASLSFSASSPGGEMVGRAVEDKFVVRYLFLPVAMILLVLYLRERRRVLLALFALACFGATAVHVLGVILIGIVFAGLALVQVVLGPNRGRTLTNLLPPAVVLAGIVALPVGYHLATTGALPSVLDNADPSRTAYRLYAWERQERLLVLGKGSYIMHPSLLKEPAVLGGYFLGIPLLLRRLRGVAREESAGAAERLLLGVLLVSPVLLFFPPVATLVGRIVGPWNLWRLSWPMLLASCLALAMALWDLLALARVFLDRYANQRPQARVRRVLVRGTAALPIALALALALAATPYAIRGTQAIETKGETPQSQSDCFDPALTTLGDDLRKPTRVLAPDNESSCLPAWSAPVSIVSFRGLAVLNNEGAIARTSGAEVEGSASARRIKDFYASPVLDPEMRRTLISRRVERVVLPADSPLVAQFDHHPAFRQLKAPGERYRIYAVDLEKLKMNRLIAANSLLNEGEYEKAARVFAAAPSRGPDDDFVALIGRGRAFIELKRYPDAVANLEAAVEIDPASTVARELLAEARKSAGDTRGARRAYEEAIKRDPRNVELRLDYGLFLITVDPQASIEEHREIVRMYPNVPEYRVKLGGALGLTGHPEEADGELAKAVELDPLSPRIQADLGKVYLVTGRPWDAVEHFERALDLDPQNQAYAYQLGSALARLSEQNPGDEDLFRRAEETLKSVDDLQPYSWEPDNRAAAKISLGDLYASRGRTGDARKAYEEAQKLDPKSGAKEKLEGLKDR